MLNDLGGAASVAMVRMGDALGLYKTLHEKGSMTCEELASAAGVHQRYLREWLAQQTASHYLTYDSATQKFTLPPEQAMMLAIEDSPVAMMGAFDGVVAWSDAQPRVQEAFKKGGGVAWGDYGPCLFCSTARFFRPGYLHNLVQNWLPALDGVVDQADRGRQGWRCRVRPWLVNRDNGAGLPQVAIRWLRLPSRLNRRSSCPRARAQRD